MLKVEVGGYFVGKARNLEEAEELVMGHLQWMDSTGKYDVVLAAGGSVTVPFVIRQRGRVAFEGDAKLHSTPDSVKSANGGVAHS
jgi:hypothetical protein